jgi:hypothetical protein
VAVIIIVIVLLIIVVVVVVEVVDNVMLLGLSRLLLLVQDTSGVLTTQLSNDL